MAGESYSSTITAFNSATAYIESAHTIIYTPAYANQMHYLRIQTLDGNTIKSISLGAKAASQQTVSYTFTTAELNTIMDSSAVTANSAQVTLVASIETFSSDNLYLQGRSNEFKVTRQIPATYVPTFTSVTAVVNNGFNGIGIRGKSSCTLTVVGAKGAGRATVSTITEYNIYNVGTLTYIGSSNTVTSSVIQTTGSLTYVATVTDSRGRTASKTVTISVVEYTVPTLTLTCFRALSNGTRDDASGTYISFTPVFKYNSITGNSIVSKSLTIAGTSKNTTFTNGTTLLFSGYALTTAYTIICTIKDAVGTTTSISAVVDIATICFNINPAKNGVGIGRYCTAANQLQVGYEANFLNGINLKGVNLIDIIYPVGSIYLSVNNTNPSTLFGGAWVAWGTGRVPVGVNSSDTDFSTVEKTGGSKTHMLATTEMPNHDHKKIHWNIDNYYFGIDSTGTAHTSGFRLTGSWGSATTTTPEKMYTGSTGGGQAHNNLQPYITCYMWKRTA